MPPTFLSLPREIRDHVYEYLLVSPTTVVTPAVVPYSEKSCIQAPTSNANGVQFALHCTDPSSSADYGEKDDAEGREVLALGIRRTCWQIYNETGGIFWDKNVFHFPSYWASRHCMGVVKILKSMGQVASRLITSISVSMGDSMFYKHLGKTLQVLASRVRHGCLRRIDLMWSVPAYKDMLKTYSSNFDDNNENVERGRRWGILIEALGNANLGMRGAERVVNLPDRKSERGAQVAGLLNLAFGGKVYWGRKLAWCQYLCVEEEGIRPPDCKDPCLSSSPVRL